MNHEVMIQQGEQHYAVLLLIDRARTPAQQKKNMFAGTWKETDNTSTDKPFGFKKDNLLAEFGLFQGTLQIGTRSTSKSSHKEGEEPHFFAEITLYGVQREATGKFKAPSGGGKGKLAHNSAPMKAGDITWSMVRYEH